MGTVPVEKYPFDCGFVQKKNSETAKIEWGTMPAAWIMSELTRLSDEHYHIIGLEQREMVNGVEMTRKIELDGEIESHGGTTLVHAVLGDWNIIQKKMDRDWSKPW